jgi:putative ABC transport system permease protein
VWNFLPVSDHLSLPGVRAAARVGKYEAELRGGGKSAQGRLVGIDRTEFPVVAFFRNDFADEPLVGLMNRLALDPTALLIDRRTWARLNLNPGDSVQVEVTSGEKRTITFKAVGVLDYFPSVYPEEGPFFIGNLEYIFESFGGLLPYDVWLRTAPEADTEAIVMGLYNMGVNVIRVQDARADVQKIFASPNRQGMLGLLSAGFITAAVLTVVGFLLYAILSFRERFIQLGVLRAIGLTAWQMGVSLIVEQLFLILTGLAAGTGVAILTAYLYIPYLPVTLSSHPGTPPYVVEVAWDNILRVYVIFGAMLLVGLFATLWSLARMKIFQAIKMGETV